MVSILTSPSVGDATVVAPTETKVLHRKVDHVPVYITSAKGNYLFTEGGERILDGCGGAAVISVGHGDERIIRALNDQAQTLSYVHSSAFTSRPAEELAQKLAKSSGMARVLFNSGGSEAVESAIKLVRQYHLDRGSPERVNFIARNQSYHGNTLGALSLHRHINRRLPYLPLLNHNSFHAVSPCYAYRYKLDGESDEAYVQRLKEELEAKFQELGPNTVAAFFAETVVGATSGCTPAVPGYFTAMKEVCERHGALFVLDEIMCGIGRTGKMHAWEWEGVQPDIQVCGKGLGGGYAPLSAVLLSSKVVDGLQQGSGAIVNGYTYQAHVYACRAGLEILKVMEDDDLVNKCHKRGQLLERLLHNRLDDHPHVGDIRGRGLFWSVELVKNKASKATYSKSDQITSQIAEKCLSGGVALYPGMKGTVDGILGDHILIAPPYTIEEDELETLVDSLADALNKVLVKAGTATR